jgi:2Fe-2S ferredoxin
VSKITFLPSNRTIEYDPATLSYQLEGTPGSILDIALNFGVAELRHSCGGICACITCHVIVKDGGQNLYPMQPDEEDRIYRIPAYTLHSRLACRAVPNGEITVLIPSKGDTRG